MIENKDKAAIILVNYNGAADSLECIRSIHKSSRRDLYEIILVDNASDYDEAFTIKAQCPDVITIRSDANNGFSAGNNMGIRYALTEGFGYILLLNNDTVIEKNMIELLMNNCNAECISAPKMMYYSHPDIIWYGGGEINLKTGGAKHTNMNCDDFDDTYIRRVTFATGCCMMIKSETFDSVGLLDESFFMYCEDTDFCIRLATNDIGINYVPTAKLYHKIGRSSGGSDSALSIYYGTRNRLNYVKKYHKYFKKTAYIFSFLSRIIRMLQSRNKQRRYAYYCGIRDHLKGISGKRI